MTKQIIALSICLILTGAIAQSTPATGLPTVPSQGTTAAKGQMTTADTAVKDTNTTLTADMATLDTAYSTAATSYNAQQSARAVLTNNVAAAAQARLALTQGQSNVVTTTAAAAALGAAQARATAMDACVATAQGWNTGVNTQVTGVAPNVVDLVTPGPAGAYQKARSANKLPSSFDSLFTTLNTHVSAMTAEMTNRKMLQAGVMQNVVGASNALWTAFSTVGNANYEDQTKLVIDPEAANGGWTGFKTNCAATIDAGAALDCGKTSFPGWLTLAGNLVGTQAAPGTGPQWWQANGAWKAWVDVDSYMTGYTGGALNLETDTSGVASALTGVLNDLSGVMDKYKIQANLVKSTLATALTNANNAVNGDTDQTTGKTKQMLDAQTTATNNLNNAKAAVTSAMADAGAWGTAKAAVKTAMDALPAARTGLMNAWNAQWTAQVALQLAQGDFNYKTAVSSAATSLNTNVGTLYTAWGSTDTAQASKVTAAETALKNQQNSTLYLINPPKKNTSRF